ncbi:MAG: hypothetical protein NTX77_14180 [Actinobacteria bacterium]|nr:hypothetical protein [Actinomycetota bacterium]
MLPGVGVTPPPPVATTTTIFNPAIPLQPVVPDTSPVLQAVDSGTTIAPDVLDPNAPVPTIDPKLFVVYDCASGIPGATIQAK